MIVARLSEKKYERVTLRQLVKRIGLQALIGSHTVNRVFAANRYPTVTFCFSFQAEDDLVYDVRVSAQESALGELGLKQGKSLAGWYLLVRIDEKGQVMLDKEKDVIGGTVYLWDSRGFWKLETLELEGGDQG